MEQGKSSNNDKGNPQDGQAPLRENTNVLLDGGFNRSSGEYPVMGLERRVEIIQLEIPFATSIKGGRTYGVSTKGIPVTKLMVWEAYKKVKVNKGSGGVDGLSLEEFSLNLENNLYKLWNRLSSGSYFPKAVREVCIPKKDGGQRKLGIPTISDRIAQQVVKDYLEARFEKIFHSNSYSYRPRRSAHDALNQVRRNVRTNDWVIDMDIKGFFDEVSHELLGKALEKHVGEDWVKMYITRWLEAPVQTEEGELKYRDGKGTPQGGVISPLLANLYLHYAFDKWLNKVHPSLKFVRYADDIIVHCKTKEQSEEVLKSISERMIACSLQLHEGKTKIVFCKQRRKQSDYKVVSFDFLGYSFQPRSSYSNGLFLGYDCGISQSSKSKILKEIKKSGFQKWSNCRIDEIASYFNKKMAGWINYYGKIRKYLLSDLFRIFDRRLIDWARNRYKRFNGSYIRASRWLNKFRESNLGLFEHWRRGFT